MSATIERIKAEAEGLRLTAQWSDVGGAPALVIWRNAGDDVLLQVAPTPLELRYVIYESDFGGRIPEHWSDTAGHALPQWLRVAYWETYQSLWGWLTHHRWRGLPEALSRLDVAILRWEHQQQALELEVSADA